MRILLDTRVVIWPASDPERLLTDCRAAIEDGANDVYVSAVSAREIALEQSLGKLELSRPAERWLTEVVRASGFEALDVDLASALRVRGLPGTTAIPSIDS